MKESVTLSAQVKDGSPDLSGGQMERLLKFYQKNDGKYVTITVSIKGKPRSLNQNRYLWGVVYELIADETGHTTEEVHAAMKQLFLPRQFLPFGGQTVEMAKSTADLKTDEFEEFIERVRSFAATELNIRIPLPNEAPL